MTAKDILLNAIIKGEIGTIDKSGVLLTLKEVRVFFEKNSNFSKRYITAFLPTATIDKGYFSASLTKYLFRLSRGIYRVHDDAIKEYILLNKIETKIHYTSNLNAYVNRIKNLNFFNI